MRTSRDIDPKSTVEYFDKFPLIFDIDFELPECLNQINETLLRFLLSLCVQLLFY
jgi:hypothetical protein